MSKGNKNPGLGSSHKMICQCKDNIALKLKILTFTNMTYMDKLFSHNLHYQSTKQQLNLIKSQSMIHRFHRTLLFNLNNGEKNV